MRRAIIFFAMVFTMGAVALGLASCGPPSSTNAVADTAQAAPEKPPFPVDDVAGWAKDAGSQCWLYDANLPKQGLTPSWNSGSCDNGPANGQGTVTWTNKDLGETTSITGSVIAGKFANRVTVVRQSVDADNSRETFTATGTVRDSVFVGPTKNTLEIVDQFGRTDASYSKDANQCPLSGGVVITPDGVTHKAHWVAGDYSDRIVGMKTAHIHDASNCRAFSYTLVPSGFVQSAADAQASADAAAQQQQEAQQQQQQATHNQCLSQCHAIQQACQSSQDSQAAVDAANTIAGMLMHQDRSQAQLEDIAHSGDCSSEDNVCEAGCP